jgi:uncharacterized protein (TIGR03435 family)
MCRVLLIAAISSSALFSQTPTPPPPTTHVFDVASIKPNRSGPPNGAWTSPIAMLVGGRFTAANVTLVDVIVQAYATRRIQMRGGPDWIDSERWDISAKADPSAAEIPRTEVPAMVQKLLEDRFQLALHHETKDMPVLALAGALPAAFKESKEGQPTVTPGERGKQTFQHFPITGLVNLTSNILHTPVVDATGIKGFYDYVLDPVQFIDAGGASPPSFPDLWETALREQLGLRLERRKAPLDIVVIDRASRPAEN